MAILTMFEVHGDPDELLATMEGEVGDLVAEKAAENGGISSTVVRTDQGVMVVNMWESEEGMERVAAEVRPRAEEAGMGQQVGWRKYEVMRHRRTGA